MRDPFNAQVDFITTDRQSSNELKQTNVMSSGRGYGLGNGDSRTWTPNSDALIRHHLQGASLHNDPISEDLNTRLLDPEMKELYFRSRSQEEEILLLRKKIADACVKELQLLNEKHILERKLSDLRMAVDEKQDDAISSALKQLNQKKSHLEENLRLANDLKVAEEDVYSFASSLLSLLAEYDVRPALLNASTITSGTKRLYQQMQRKSRSLNDSLGDINQAGNLYNADPQQAAPSRTPPSPSYMDAKMNNFHQYTQRPSDPRGDQLYNQSRLIPDFDAMVMKEVDPGFDADSQFYMPTGHGDQDFLANGEFPLPGIEGFQIIGDPKPGTMLKACGYPTNGTTLCTFQWVRYLENGTRQSIEGATVPEYVVTADDVDAVLAVDCTPMDDNSRQGELVREFANNNNKITCDQDMQHKLDTCISNGRAIFNVLVLVDSTDDWELAILTLRRPSYQIKIKRTDEVIIEEKYSTELNIKVPNGLSTQFVLISSGGINLPFTTEGTTQPNSMESDVWLRDVIVLAIRTFQNKALDRKKKGKTY